MFGVIITELRKTKTKNTQLDMAKILGVAKTTYASYEQGKRMPDVEIQKKIAEYYNVSLDYLHGRDKEINSSEQLTNEQMTVAAHIDEDVTDEEMEDILNYIEFIKKKHREKEKEK